MRRTQQRGLTLMQAGLIALLLTVLACYFAFTKAVPFQDHFEIKAAFKTSNNLKPGSFVRLAGVNVGKVTAVERDDPDNPSAAVVTMRLDERGLPIRKDARFTIRPRLFFEGNFFVDIQPGTPTAPLLGDADDDDYVVPTQQTATPVQFDQILTALESDTRSHLKVVLDEYGKALERGGDGYRRATRYFEPAYRDGAIVADAQLGLERHDLSNYIRDAGIVARALDAEPQQLKDLISGLNATARGFARQAAELEATVEELPRLLRVGQPALAELNASFPPLRRLIADLRPAVRNSPEALDATLPLVRELRGLVRDDELRGLARDLRGSVPALARLNGETPALADQSGRLSSCQTDVILPFVHQKVPDAFFPPEGPIYQEQAQVLPGLAGESRSGDANGQWFRVLLSSGNLVYRLGGNRFFTAASPILGVNPPPPSRRTPYEYDEDCEKQELPDLRTVPGPPPARVDTGELDAAGRARAAKARSVAVEWLRDHVKYEGLQNEVRVVDDVIGLADLPRLKGKLGTLEP